MPKFDFDAVQLGHGSGGILSYKLLETGVFNILANDKLNEKHDGAYFEATGRMAFSTDSFVVQPLFFPGGNIGELAIYGTVNDLAMCGAMAKYISLSFILEEGLPMEQLWQIMHSIKAACDRAGVQVITGDTKVVEKGKGDGIFINTSGIGVVHEKADISMYRVKPGDTILCSGMLAQHGIAIMSKRNGLEFDTDVVSDTAPLNQSVKKLLDCAGGKIHFLRDATRGGVASVLNELAKDAVLGIEINEKDLQLEEQVAGACEMLGLDPLYVANEGKFLAVVDASVADICLSVLKEDEFGRHASIIGKVKDEHNGQVLMKSRIGGRRVVNMLPGEQLPRIC